MTVKQPILFVDDDAAMLEAVKRRLRGKYRIDIATGSVRALEAVTERGPYAVVVSDLRLPGLDGISFLDRLKRTCPDTVRIMLTGHADLAAAMNAVNTGQVFRFLVKPCGPQELDEALAAAMAAYLQAAAERSFLKGTLRGIIKVLTDLLGLLNAEALARSSRVKRLVLDMARYLEVPDIWRIELAVTLSQVGATVMPESMYAALRTRGTLDGDRARLFERAPGIAADLLSNIPRLNEVADIIRWQNTPYDGTGAGPDAPTGQDIPFGARLLKVALDFDRLLTSGHGRDAALALLAERRGHYDPQLLDLLTTLAGSWEGYVKGESTIASLTAGMVLEECLRLRTGETVAAAGQVVDELLRERLGAMDMDGLTTVRVLIPAGDDMLPPGLDPALLTLLRKVRNAPPVD